MLKPISRLATTSGNAGKQAKIFFDDMPPKFRYIAYLLMAVMVLLIAWLFIKWAFLDKPNSLEWHTKQAEKALEADYAVTELLHNQKDQQGRNVVQQIRENPNGVVNGVKLKPSDNDSPTKALDVVKKSVAAVDENNRVIAQAGGITIETINQSYNGKPKDPYAAKKIQRALQQAGINTGTNTTEGLSEAQLGASAYSPY